MGLTEWFSLSRAKGFDAVYAVVMHNVLPLPSLKYEQATMIQQVLITDTLHADAGRTRCRAVDVHHVLAWCLRQQCGPAGRILDGMWGASMNALVPLESLSEAERGSDLPLPSEPATPYGRLLFASQPGRPYIIG